MPKRLLACCAILPVVLTLIAYINGESQWTEVTEQSRTLAFFTQLLSLVGITIISRKSRDWQLIGLTLLTTITIWFFLITIPFWVDAVHVRKLVTGIRSLMVGGFWVIVCLILQVTMMRKQKSKPLFFLGVALNLITVFLIIKDTGELINTYDELT